MSHPTGKDLTILLFSVTSLPQTENHTLVEVNFQTRDLPKQAQDELQISGILQIILEEKDGVISILQNC